MKKNLLLVTCLVLFSVFAKAQAPSIAYDQVSGGMLFEDGKDYAVVQMEGTQKELHDLVMSNLTRIFSNANDNVTSFNDASISMTGVAKLFTLNLPMGIRQTWTARIKMDIAIKDGRIRISAPAFLTFYANDEQFVPYGGSFKTWSDWYIYKSESKKKKHGYAIKQMNSNMTSIVKSIISKDVDNW